MTPEEKWNWIMAICGIIFIIGKLNEEYKVCSISFNGCIP